MNHTFQAVLAFTVLIGFPILLYFIISTTKNKKNERWFFETRPINMFINNNINFVLQTGKYYSNFFDYKYVQDWDNNLNNGMQQLLTNYKNIILQNVKNPNCYKDVITSKGTIREIKIGRLRINKYYLGSDGNGVPPCTRINYNGVIDDISGGFRNYHFEEVIISYGFYLNYLGDHDIYSKTDTIEMYGHQLHTTLGKTSEYDVRVYIQLANY